MESLPVVSTEVESAISLSAAEQYQLLLQQLHAIRMERATRAHMELVLAKYEAGHAIASSPLYMGKGHPGSGSLLLQVGRDLNWSKTEMYSCLRFHEAVEEHGGKEQLQFYLDSFGWGNAMSWTKLKQRLNESQSRPKLRKADRTWSSTRTDRIDAVKFAAKKIGRVWTEDDQTRLSRLLNIALTQSET